MCVSFGTQQEIQFYDFVYRLLSPDKAIFNVDDASLVK